MSRLVDRRVAIPTVHLELSGMDHVAKRYRLLRSIAHIQGDGVGYAQEHRSSVHNGAANDRQAQQSQEFVGPTRK